MSGPDAPRLREYFIPLGGVSAALLFLTYWSEIMGNAFAVTEDDIPAVVYIEGEQGWAHKGGPSFDLTVEGQWVRIPVGYNDSENYNPGDEIGISYDRHTWKDGSVTISDVKLRK